MKTSVLIDLTDCEPPAAASGGGEECFKVVRGEVDCVPGGGAFIYHMPVGPEMGGKWVADLDHDARHHHHRRPATGAGRRRCAQLDDRRGIDPATSSTSSSPASRPMPGRKRVSACAARRPSTSSFRVDLDCPPDKEPDLKVEKRADVTRCTMDGGCDFTIRVTNVGGAPYHGKIVLDEVTLPGRRLARFRAESALGLRAGDQPDDLHASGDHAQPGRLRRSQARLQARPGAGKARFIRNCAAYDYAASGKPVFGDPPTTAACAVDPDLPAWP